MFAALREELLDLPQRSFGLRRPTLEVTGDLQAVRLTERSGLTACQLMGLSPAEAALPATRLLSRTRTAVRRCQYANSQRPCPRGT